LDLITKSSKQSPTRNEVMVKLLDPMVDSTWFRVVIRK